MSDFQPSHEVGSYGGKMLVGAGISLFGAITLDQMALIAGILCSLVVTGHSLWRWFTDWQDRKAKKAAEREPEPEGWV